MSHFDPLSEEEKARFGRSGKATKDDGVAMVPVPDDVPLKVPSHSMGAPMLTWEYRDQQGKLIFAVCRFMTADGKEDRPLTYRQFKDGSRRWCWKSVDVPRPLYGLDRLAAHLDAPVLVCEGEKATDAAQSLFPDYVAVTSPNGAGSPHCADWTPLKGRSVTIWPDNDDEGRKYAANVARILKKINKGK